MELERARSRSARSVGRCSSCWPKSARPGQMIMRPNGMRLIWRSHLHNRASTTPWPRPSGPARGARSGTPAGRRRQLRSLDPSCLLLRQPSLAPKLFWLEPGIAVNRAWRILLHWRLLRPGDLRYEGLTNQSPRKREQPGAVPLGRAFPLTSPDGQ